MKKTAFRLTILFVICTAVCCCLYMALGNKVILAAAITAGTTAYHFIMRLGVGFIFNKAMGNRADYTKRWYRCRAWEKKLYKRLKVKRWKGLMPTYAANLFDHTKHSWRQIAQASCQAELVHETIILLSFVPMFFSRWFGGILVFITTSLLAALFDLSFVIIQRYNRPRILRLLGR